MGKQKSDDELKQQLAKLTEAIAKAQQDLVENQSAKQEGLARFAAEQASFQSKITDIETRLRERTQIYAIDEAKILGEIENLQSACIALQNRMTLEEIDLSAEKLEVEAQLAAKQQEQTQAHSAHETAQTNDTTELQLTQVALNESTQQQTAFTTQIAQVRSEIDTRLQALSTEMEGITIEIAAQEQAARSELNAANDNDNDDDEPPLALRQQQVALLPENHSSAKRFLRQLNISDDSLTQMFEQHPEPHLTLKWFLDGLEKILQLENSVSGTVRWATLDVLIIKIFQGAVKKTSLRPPQSLDELEARGANLRAGSFYENIMIPRGRTMLLQSNAARMRLQATAGFIEGFEHAIISSMHVTLWGVLIYELIIPIIEHTQVDVWQVLDIFRRYEEVGSNSIVRFLAKLPPSITSTALPAFILLSASTLAFLHGRHAGHFSEQEYKKFIVKLKHLKVNWFKDNLGFIFSLRWVIPFSLLPPLFFESPFVLAEQWLLQEGALTPSQTRELWSVLKNFGLNHSRFLQREAMHTIANIAHGIALRDLLILHAEGVSEEKLALLILMKLEAFTVLRTLGASLRLDKESKGIYQGYLKPMSRYVYANYLLWWLGYQNYLLRKPALSKVAGFLFLVWKLAKLALKVKLVRLIVICILEVIQCPDLPYVQFGKEIPVYANKLDINCFNAVLKLFRSLPGEENQPVTNLTAIIPQFDFWLRDSAGNPIAPGLTDLDLSGKYLRAFEAAQILDALAQHKNNGVDLVSVNLEKQDFKTNHFFSMFCQKNLKLCHFWDGMSQLVRSLAAWPNLKNFDYSGNPGYLETYNISYNYMAFGNGLSQLTTLQMLDLSSNEIGPTDIRGVVTIIQGLGYLTNLRFLSLSGNHLARYNETIGIGECFHNLLLLEFLDLSDTDLGNFPPDLFACMQSVAQMQQLKILLVGSNFIRKSGVSSLIDAFLALPTLDYLDISVNDMNFTQQNLVIQKIPPYRLSSICFLELDPSDPSSPLLLDAYLQAMPNDSELFTFPRQSYKGLSFEACKLSLSNLTLPILVANLVKFSNLRGLSLEIDFNSKSVELFSVRLLSLHQLQHLSLYPTQEGAPTDNIGIAAISEALGYLTNLQYLYLDFGLELYANSSSNLESETMGRSLHYLTEMQYLNLVGCGIGSTGTSGVEAIGQGLRYLTKLQHLGIRSNDIELKGTSGSEAIGQSIPYLTQLQYLYLDYNFIGRNSTTGIEKIGKNLQFLTNLRQLYLQGNAIEAIDTAGTEAIAYGITNITTLRLLTLEQNKIGYHGPAGINALVIAIKLLPAELHVSLLDPNISSTKIFNIIAEQRFRALNQSCNDHRCHVNIQISSRVNNQSLSSSATRLSAPNIYIYLAQMLSLPTVILNKNVLLVQVSRLISSSSPTLQGLNWSDVIDTAIRNSSSALLYASTLVTINYYLHAQNTSPSQLAVTQVLLALCAPTVIEIGLFPLAIIMSLSTFIMTHGLTHSEFTLLTGSVLLALVLAGVNNSIEDAAHFTASSLAAIAMQKIIENNIAPKLTVFFANRPSTQECTSVSSSSSATPYNGP